MTDKSADTSNLELLERDLFLGLDQQVLDQATPEEWCGNNASIMTSFLLSAPLQSPEENEEEIKDTEDSCDGHYSV